MRVPIFLLVAVACFFVVPADARPPQANSNSVSACSDLKGGTKGLHGLCVAFCAQQDQSNVDMNDIASVRAAAPNVTLLQEYNDRKTAGDPGMPCMSDDGDSDDGDSDDTPPPVTSCGCWSGEEVGTIIGDLDPVRGMAPGVQCTANQNDAGVYEAQVYEGYNLGTTSETVVSSAFAYVSADGGATAQGCMFDSPTVEPRNFPLTERAEGEFCVQMIVDHCAAM